MPRAADRSDEGKTLFQERLEEVMGEEKIATNAGLARFLGRQAQTTINWFKGRSDNMSWQDLFHIADKFKVNPRWLVEKNMPKKIPTNGTRGSLTTELEAKYKLFITTKNPSYRDLADAFVMGIRALAADTGWIGKLQDEQPRIDRGPHGASNPARKAKRGGYRRT